MIVRVIGMENLQVGCERRLVFEIVIWNKINVILIRT